MKTYTSPIGLLLLLATVAVAQEQASEPETLTRGPVHEAFAEQVNMTPKPGLIVPRIPPEPIEETPPEFKPDGDDVKWIPGYWAWDDERKDFLWISGVWRKLPPNRKWVAGYWNKTEEGYQWIAGYWGTLKAQAAPQYLQTPPQSL